MDNNNTKTYNLRAISHVSFLIDVFALLCVSAIFWRILPYEEIGTKNMMFLNAIFCAISLAFMIILEKYTPLILSMHEKVVINILSLLYSFVIMQVINIFLFVSKERFIEDLLILFSSAILISALDFVVLCLIKNGHNHRMPRLLIVSSKNKTFMRMKRIKYGALRTYDSWYETLEGLSNDEFQKFADEQFDKFDAICILDGLDESHYNIAVKSAINKQKDLFIVPNMIDVGKTNARLVRFDDVLTLYMPKNYVSKPELATKRIMDIVVSLIGFVVAAIPMLIIAVAIKLTSPGPILYKQERLTINKKPFMIYKFRTMIPDAEKLTGPKFAEKDDPRITKIGKILRACRLDELPQILNILKGDMSIVGPRPERPVFVEQFEKEIENYDYRFAVKAGLTSLSHVYGRYSTYIHDRTYYDLYYITNYSFILDLKIILLTSKTMFLKDAAEGEDNFKEKTSASNFDVENKSKEREEAVK